MTATWYKPNIYHLFTCLCLFTCQALISLLPGLSWEPWKQIFTQNVWQQHISLLCACVLSTPTIPGMPRPLFPFGPSEPFSPGGPCRPPGPGGPKRPTNHRLGHKWTRNYETSWVHLSVWKQSHVYRVPGGYNEHLWGRIITSVFPEVAKLVVSNLWNICDLEVNTVSEIICSFWRDLLSLKVYTYVLITFVFWTETALQWTLASLFSLRSFWG